VDELDLDPGAERARLDRQPISLTQDGLNRDRDGQAER
jgi:hypothetical protein